MTRSSFHKFLAGLVGVVVCAALSTTAVAQQLVLRDPKTGTVRALVIGIDDYHYVRQLKGAVADAKDLTQSLRKMGVHDVVTLINDEANRSNFLRQVNLLESRIVPGDMVIFTIAGHGAQEPERVKGSQPDGMDDVFLLPGFDFRTEAGSKQRVLGAEFNHIIKAFEAHGARVLFVADTCHGGGLTRSVDPRAAQLSYREIPHYRLVADDLKPISTKADAFLTPLDFKRTTFLAAVDRHTKSPEVHIPGIPGYRGALSYAMARAFEGRADRNHDGKVTVHELFSNVRQVVYQLSDQRQNIVTMISPDHNINRDVAFDVTRGVHIIENAPPVASAPPGRPVVAVSTVKIMDAAAPVTPQHSIVTAMAAKPNVVSIGPVRLASLDGRTSDFSGLKPLNATFKVVAPTANPDLVWDPASRDVLSGGDVIAYDIGKSDLPSVIDREAAVRGFKRLASFSPQIIRTAPNDKVHHRDSRIQIKVSNIRGRAMVMFDIAGDGTVQALYPIGSDPIIVPSESYHFPVRVRSPFGADQVVVVSSAKRMTALEQVVRELDQRRSALEALKMVQRYAPPDARIGITGLFTAP